METAQPAGGAGGKFEDRLPVVTRVRKCGGTDGDPYERSHSDKFTKKVVDPQQQALLEAVRRPRGYFLAKEVTPATLPIEPLRRCTRRYTNAFLGPDVAVYQTIWLPQACF